MLKLFNKEKNTSNTEKINEHVKNVAEKTGWEIDYTMKQMKVAKANIGISNKDYDEYDFHRFTPDEYESEYKKVLEHKEKKKKNWEKNVSDVMEKTGWDREKTVSELRAARERCGIKSRDYNKYNFHSFPEDKQIEAFNLIKEKKAAASRKKEFNITRIMDASGWDRERTIEELKKAKEEYGAGAASFFNYGFYRLDEQEKAIAAEKIKAAAEKKAEQKEAFITTVMEATGWSHDEAKEKMDRSFEISGAEYRDYCLYKFWNIDDETQKTYFTKGFSNQLRNKYNTRPENVKFFKNKVEFDKKFNDFLGRPWSETEGLTLDDFKSRFAGETRLIYKPLEESGGHGVTIYDIDGNMEEIYDKISSRNPGIVERVLVQHSEMAKMSFKSLNTIRMLTIRTDETNVDVVFGVVKMGGGDSVVDNLSGGGVAAGVNIETGKIETSAVDINCNYYDIHPYTDQPIIGFKIPFWEEAVKLVQKAALLVDGIGYIGWDVAITENGPVIIEGNTYSAPRLVQQAYDKDMHGVRKVLEKYL